LQLVLTLGLVLISKAAFAFSGTSTFASDVLALMSDIVDGPIGQATSLGLIATGAGMMMFRQPLAGIMGIISGGVIAMAPTITTSLGAVLY
jgi:hypothetical protein